MTITIAQILKKIDEHLAADEMGYMALTSEEARYVRDWALLLIHERDNLLYESEQRHSLVTEKEARDANT